MKSLMTIIVSGAVTGAVLISTSVRGQAVNAPQDSTTQVPYENKLNVNYQKEHAMKPIKASDVPSPLKKVLQGDEYKGWQKGTISRTGNGKIYEFRIVNGAEQKVYRFTAEGEPIVSGQ
jgi:hypothetical protein